MIVGERLNVDDESHGPADALKYRPKSKNLNHFSKSSGFHQERFYF